MIRISTPNGSVECQPPKQWDELSKDQFLAAIELTVDPPITGKHIRIFLIKFDPAFTQVVDDLISPELFAILEHFEFLLKPPADFRSNISKHSFWHGPKNHFSNLVWGQYGLADQLKERYLKHSTPDGEQIPPDEILNAFWGVLYTPFGIPFNHRRADWWAKLAAAVPKKTKMLALYNFMSMRGWLPIHYPLTFSNKKKGAAGRDFGMLGLNVQLSGTKFGTRHDLELTKMHDVLIHLEQNAEAASKVGH